MKKDEKKMSKTDLYVRMLKRKGGATVDELAEAAVKELNADYNKSKATARTQIFGHLPKRFIIEKISEAVPARYRIVGEKKK